MKKFLKIIKYMRPHWPQIAISLTFNLISIFFSLFSLTMIIPFLKVLFEKQQTIVHPPAFQFTAASIQQNFYYLIGNFVETRGKASALIFVAIMIVILTLLKNLFLYLGYFFLAPARNNIVRDIRNTIFNKVLTLPIGFFSNERKGDIISRITNDVNEVEASIIRSLDLVFREPVTIIVYAAALIFISPQLTVFVLILLPLSGIVIGNIGRSLRKTSFRGQRKMGSILSIVEETLGGLRVIKAFNAENKVNEKFKTENSLYTKLMIKMWRRRDLASPLSEFLGVAVMASVIIYGGSLVLGSSKHLTSEAFIGYLAVFSQIINPAKSFTNAYYNVLKGMASADRIEAIIGAEITIKDKENAKPIKSFKHSIEYRDVCFMYEKDNVLKDINLKIEKGKTVALVGQSGSGKTTLADLLPRLWDIEEGDILIDDISIKDLKIKDLRNLMGNVNQDPILFNDTFFNNIAFGVNDATIEDVINAAKVANAHEFIMSTRKGYDANIGDRGGKLSGGQRQRISIARAVLKNPPIMILDEATSALDTESERLVQEALINLMKNRTTLVIAHRLSTVIHADEICVIHEGRIVERGRHNTLLQLNGYYKKLHDLQMFAA